MNHDHHHRIRVNASLSTRDSGTVTQTRILCQVVRVWPWQSLPRSHCSLRPVLRLDDEHDAPEVRVRGRQARAERPCYWVLWLGSGSWRWHVRHSRSLAKLWSWAQLGPLAVTVLLLPGCGLRLAGIGARGAESEGQCPRHSCGFAVTVVPSSQELAGPGPRARGDRESGPRGRRGPDLRHPSPGRVDHYRNSFRTWPRAGSP